MEVKIRITEACIYAPSQGGETQHLPVGAELEVPAQDAIELAGSGRAVRIEAFSPKMREAATPET
jgi:hypothetical protein